MKDRLRIPKAGDPLSASQQAIIVQMLKATQSGPNCFVDSSGVHVRPSAKPDIFVLRFGRLKEASEYGDTTGITVDEYTINDDNEWEDSNNDIEYVLPPPWLTSGDVVAAGTKVIVAKSKGKWHIVAPLNIPTGTSTNDMLYWDATEGEWTVLAAPSRSGVWALAVDAGTLKWYPTTTQCADEEPPT